MRAHADTDSRREFLERMWEWDKATNQDQARDQRYKRRSSGALSKDVQPDSGNDEETRNLTEQSAQQMRRSSGALQRNKNTTRNTGGIGFTRNGKMIGTSLQEPD